MSRIIARIRGFLDRFPDLFVLHVVAYDPNGQEGPIGRNAVNYHGCCEGQNADENGGFVVRDRRIEHRDYDAGQA